MTNTTPRPASDRDTTSSLDGRVVVVAGGAGEVGEGVVRILLRAGATVIAPSRALDKLDALRAAVGPVGADRLRAPQLDIGAAAGSDALRAVVDREGRLDAVVSSIGGFWQGPRLPEVGLEVFRDALEQRVFPHLRLIQALGPLLPPGDGVFVHISGMAALLGMPHLSALGVSAAAQLAVTRAFLAEAGRDGPRVFGLVIEQIVRTRSQQELPADALTADEVGEVVRALIHEREPGDMRGLRKVEGRVEVDPLPTPINPASAERLARAFGG